MKLTEQCDGIMFLTSMLSAEQTQNWDKEKWIDALGRSADKPRMEHCKDQNGTVIYIRVLVSLTQILLSWKEHIFHTGTSSDYKSILED